MEAIKLLEELVELSIREHYREDEDNWYSCPLAPDGCLDWGVPEGICNCGATEHNRSVLETADKLFKILKGN